MDKRKIQRVFAPGIAALVVSSLLALSEPAAAQGSVGSLARSGEPVPVSIVGSNEEAFSKWSAPSLSFDVPVDKRLVIELVTGRNFADELHSHIRVLITTGTEQVAHIIAPKVRLPGDASFLPAFMATEQVKISADPGAKISVYWLPSQNAEVSIAGHYSPVP